MKPVRIFAVLLTALFPFMAFAESPTFYAIDGEKIVVDEAAGLGLSASVGAEARTVGAPRVVVGFKYKGIDGSDQQSWFTVEGQLGLNGTDGVVTSLQLRIVPYVGGPGIDAADLSLFPIVLSRNTDVGLQAKATAYVASVHRTFGGELNDEKTARLYLDMVIDLLGASILKVEGDDELRWIPEWWRPELTLRGEFDLKKDMMLKVELKATSAIPAGPSEAIARISLLFKAFKHDMRAYLEGGLRQETLGINSKNQTEIADPFMFVGGGLEIRF